MTEMTLTYLKFLKPPYLKALLFFIPILGMVLFLVFYSIAAMKYPGGSWRFPHQPGFSFWNNYLCDLLGTHAINGKYNTASYFAQISLYILNCSLILVWNKLSIFFSNKSINKSIMQLSGNLALVTTLFLTSGKHDITIRIAGSLGVIAFVSCFIELFKAKIFRLFNFGLVCLTIFLANYFIYETGIAIKSLPIIQKITFALFLAWFSFLNTFISKTAKKKLQNNTTLL